MPDASHAMSGSGQGPMWACWSERWEVAGVFRRRRDQPLACAGGPQGGPGASETTVGAPQNPADRLPRSRQWAPGCSYVRCAAAGPGASEKLPSAGVVRWVEPSSGRVVERVAALTHGRRSKDSCRVGGPAHCALCTTCLGGTMPGLGPVTGSVTHCHVDVVSTSFLPRRSGQSFTRSFALPGRKAVGVA